jgi:hypothetical protein
MAINILKIKVDKEICLVKEPDPVIGATVGTELTDDGEDDEVVKPEVEVAHSLVEAGAEMDGLEVPSIADVVVLPFVSVGEELDTLPDPLLDSVPDLLLDPLPLDPLLDPLLDSAPDPLLDPL